MFAPIIFEKPIEVQSYKSPIIFDTAFLKDALFNRNKGSVDNYILDDEILIKTSQGDIVVQDSKHFTINKVLFEITSSIDFTDLVNYVENLDK